VQTGASDRHLPIESSRGKQPQGPGDRLHPLLAGHGALLPGRDRPCPIRITRATTGVRSLRRSDTRRRLSAGETSAIDSSPPSGYRACHMRIEVHDNQVESALKTMKKLMLKDGLFKEMKKRAYYEKPSVKRKRKQAEARKKRRKAMKRAETDD
jgi:small subunit ribosomal protein S21